MTAEEREELEKILYKKELNKEVKREKNSTENISKKVEWKWWPVARLNRKQILFVIAFGILSFIVGSFLLAINETKLSSFLISFSLIITPISIIIWMIEKARVVSQEDAGKVALITLILYLFIYYFLGRTGDIFAIASQIFGIAWLVKKIKKKKMAKKKLKII